MATTGVAVPIGSLRRESFTRKIALKLIACAPENVESGNVEIVAFRRGTRTSRPCAARMDRIRRQSRPASFAGIPRHAADDATEAYIGGADKLLDVEGTLADATTAESFLARS